MWKLSCSGGMSSTNINISFLPLFNLVRVVWALGLQMLKKSHKLVKRGSFVPQKWWKEVFESKKFFAVYLQHICSIVAAYLQYSDWNNSNICPPLYPGYFLIYYHVTFFVWVLFTKKMTLIALFFYHARCAAAACQLLPGGIWRKSFF